jgi:glyoxylate carboligase
MKVQLKIPQQPAGFSEITDVIQKPSQRGSLMTAGAWVVDLRKTHPFLKLSFNRRPQKPARIYEIASKKRFFPDGCF